MEESSQLISTNCPSSTQESRLKQLEEDVALIKEMQGTFGKITARTSRRINRVLKELRKWKKTSTLTISRIHR